MGPGRATGSLSRLWAWLSPCELPYAPQPLHMVWFLEQRQRRATNTSSILPGHGHDTTGGSGITFKAGGPTLGFTSCLLPVASLHFAPIHFTIVTILLTTYARSMQVTYLQPPVLPDPACH